MNVSINFPEAIETNLRRRAAAAGMDVATFVQEVVSERLAEDSMPTRAQSHEEFLSKLQGIIALHPKSSGFVDDSRDSIYAGRGE
jgi:hypothetical protein